MDLAPIKSSLIVQQCSVKDTNYGSSTALIHVVVSTALCAHLLHPVYVRGQINQLARSSLVCSWYLFKSLVKQEAKYRISHLCDAHLANIFS